MIRGRWMIYCVFHWKEPKGWGIDVSSIILTNEASWLNNEQRQCLRIVQLTNREGWTFLFLNPTLFQQQGSNRLTRVEKGKNKLDDVLKTVWLLFMHTSVHANFTDLLLIRPEVKKEIDDEFHQPLLHNYTSETGSETKLSLSDYYSV